MRFRLNLNQVRIFFVALALVLAGAGVGYRLGVHSTYVGGVKKTSRFSLDLFWQTWDLLNEKFYYQDRLDPRRAIYGAIAGLVASADDPYTVFLDPQSNSRMEEDIAGQFGGIGVQLDYFDDQIGVVAPLKGCPAQAAGIRSGDLILKVGETDLLGVSLPEVVNLIRGEPGTEVVLEIFSEGDVEPRTVTVERAIIDVPSLELEFAEDWCGRTDCKPVAVLSLSRFGDQTQLEWVTAVDEIVAYCQLNSGCAGVVLDLRGNPGGYLEDSVFVASEFLDSGTIFYQQEAEAEPVGYEVDRRGRLTKDPLAVLIDRGSASASEIVAGALQQHQRALLVGEKSFGKGSIQEPLDLEAGAGIHITVAQWLLPDKTSVSGVGLTPDLEVQLSGDSQDEGLQLAIELVAERGVNAD